ncbi:BatD family protein [Arachidicoccus soli]|uniref:Protein BatD n=1 Tax=Arachidicoccus soli TaxID=2341117 RepID=A0A386HNX2_9BACT|nr:BatD family protein [Arachidicoccus soli]AYD47617.1 hypothetical protein D6B99_08360 [Arachidicoccus soli]
MSKWKILFIAFLLLIAATGSAQMSLSLSVSNKTIGSQDPLEVTYSYKNITAQQDAPSPDFNDWSQQGTSSSSSVSIINGKSTSSVDYTFTLLPKRTGRLTVPGLSVTINGQKLKCDAVSIEVKSKPHLASAQPAAASPNGLQMPNLSSLFGDMGMDDAPPPTTDIIVHKGESLEEATKGKLLIRILPNKTTCYLGEPILADYQFLSSVNCSWRPVKVPSFSSFSVADIQQNQYPFNVQVDGKNYRAQSVRKVQLTPLKTGRILLDSCSVNSQANYLDAATGEYRSANFLTKSSPKYIEVLPLPTKNQPADFSGAIGNFSIVATVEKNSLPAQENNNLHIEITGTGNLDGVTIPEIHWPANIQAYDSRDSQAVDKSQFPMPRSLTFDVPFIGNKEGTAIIPAIKFTYFDPQKKDYQTISSDSIKLSFAAAAPITEMPIITNAGSQRYLWIIIGIALLLLVIMFLSWKLKKSNKDKDKEQEKAATTSTEEPLPIFVNKTEEALEEKKKMLNDSLLDLQLESDSHQFFPLAKALMIQFLQDKLNTSSSDENELLKQLQHSNSSITNSVTNIISRCNKALYMPVVSASEREEVLKQIKALIR